MDLGHKTLTMLGISLKNENLNLSRLNLDRPILFSCQEESIEHLAMGMRFNRSIRAFSMRNAGLRDRGCYLLCDNLCLNSTLQELDLASNRLPEDAGMSLCKLLSDNSSIQRLNLANNELHDRGCEHISVALGDYPNIMHLDLAHNGKDSPKFSIVTEALIQTSLQKPASSSSALTVASPRRRRVSVSQG